jgi:hypothetical protein
VRSPFDVEPLVLGSSLTTNTPVAVAAADLDEDGDMDIVSTNANGDNLTIFLQESPGSFATSPITLGSVATNGPVAVIASDLDGDDDLDLVSANEIGSNLTIFPQESPGSFATSPFRLGGLGTTHRPVAVAAADLDSDGDLDLVSANSFSSNLTVFFQNSPGRFAAVPLALGGFETTATPLSVAAADLDCDGDMDLASANSGGSTLTVFMQASPGIFAVSPLVLGEFVTNAPVSVIASDLDDDGDQDLVSANFRGDNLTAFMQESPGNFASAPLFFGDNVTTRGPFSVVAADVDGDGDQDLVVASTGSDLAVFLQTSPGNFAALPFFLAGFSAPSVAAADMEGDGDMDLVSVDLSSNNLKVFLQESPGSFSATPSILGSSFSTIAPSFVAAADLDGDGQLDVGSANTHGDSLTVFVQNTPGNFDGTPRVLQTGPSLPLSFVPADFDNDGDADLASANNHGLMVFVQESPGNFAEGRFLDRLNSFSSIIAGDTDGDGNMDLALAGDDNLTVFMQESPGVFATIPVILGSFGTTDNPQSIAAADFDRDGDLDLASANYGSDNLTVFAQESSGMFAISPVTIGGSGTTDNPKSIAAEDFDGDGDLDLASANSGGNNMTIFLQESHGGFATVPLVLGDAGTTDRPQSVAASDLDGDGDQDLVSGNGGDDFGQGSNLTVFFQLSPGSFPALPLVLGNLATTNFPASIAAVDIDGDGDKDLASANFRGSNLSVFWGGR